MDYRLEFKRRAVFWRAEELLSVDGLKHLDRYGVSLVDVNFLRNLKVFRVWLDRPVVVNKGFDRLRGFRSWKEHADLYAGMGRPVVEHSMHLYGRAVDFKVPGMRVGRVVEKVMEFNERSEEAIFTGVGIYETFVHVDMRDSLNNRVAKWIG